MAKQIVYLVKESRSERLTNGVWFTRYNEVEMVFSDYHAAYVYASSLFNVSSTEMKLENDNGFNPDYVSTPKGEYDDIINQRWIAENDQVGLVVDIYRHEVV